MLVVFPYKIKYGIGLSALTDTFDDKRKVSFGFLPRCKLLFNFPFHIATITSQQYGILYVKIIFSRDFLLQTTTFSRDFLS